MITPPHIESPISNRVARVAIITGAARGIGRAIALKLAAQGATVLSLDKDESSLQKIESSFVVDVSDKNQVQEVIQKIIGKYGTIDILVNNAGITRDNLLAKISVEDWDQVMAVNLRSAFLLSQAVVPTMKERKFGRIINIASRSWLGNIGQANYAASKGGLVSLTRTLALELAKDQITVNAVAPGLIDTEMTQAIPEKAMEKLMRLQPMGKMGSVQDIANAVAFLANDETGYITGQVLHVDGGKSCGLLSL